MFSTNQNAEIVACILLRKEYFIIYPKYNFLTFFKLDLYNSVVHSDNWDHVFPCPNGKVTRPRRSDGPSFLPWLYRGIFYVWASGLCSLYRRICYIEVRYIEVLSIHCTVILAGT